MSNIWKRVCYWILTWYVQRTPQVLLVFSELRPRYVWGSNPAKTISRLCELGTLSGWPRLGKFTTETIGGTQVIFWHIGGAMAEFNDWPIKPWLFSCNNGKSTNSIKSHGFWYFWWIFHCYFKVSDGSSTPPRSWRPTRRVQLVEAGCRHFRWHIVAESVADSHVHVFQIQINIRDC